MRSAKGCINKSCVANKKSTIYKTADDYCSKCGNKLYYVCAKCYTQLPDNSEKYCMRCLAEKRDRNDRNGKIAVGAVGAIGLAAVTTGKKVLGVIAKFK